MIRNEDILWKGLVEACFPDFIRFIHPGIDRQIDLDKGYEFLDNELAQVYNPSDRMDAPKAVDKLVKVYLQDDSCDWVLFHFEFQAAYREDFSKRMYTYFYRLMDKYNKDISAYAIFTEASNKDRPAFFKKSFSGTELTYQYNTFKITTPTDEELFAHENPFAIAILAAKIAGSCRHIKDVKERDLAKKHLKIELIRYLFSKRLEEKTTLALLHFISFYVLFDLKETKVTFANELHILTQNSTKMSIEEQIREIVKNEAFEEGKEEGKEKGKEEGKTELTVHLVNHMIHNLKYADEQVAEALQIPLTVVRKLHQQRAS